MEESRRSNIDHLTGLPKDVLSFLIFTFFPTSYRHFRYRENFCGDALLDKSDKNVTSTGSLPEHLDLPVLLHETLTETEYIMPDEDLMFNVHIDYKKEVQTDNVRPGYCRVEKPTGEGESELCKPGELLEFVKQAFPVMGSTLHMTGRMFSVNNLNAPVNQAINFPQNVKMGDENVSSDTVSAMLSLTSYAFGHSDIKQSCDMVCALFIYTPTEVVDNFLERICDKAWPPSELIMEEFLKGCHAIPKKNPLDPEGYDWRISFSGLEVKLARTLNDVQRICYRVLKAVVMSEINYGAADGEELASYFLKTTLFWLCEEMHPEFFEERNVASIWIALLDKITHSVFNRNIRNYFIPGCNMIEHTSPNVTKNWLLKLQYIRKNPIKAFAKFWKIYHLNTYICRRQTWEQSYLEALNNIDLVKLDQHFPLLAKRTIQPIMAFYIMDSNLTDWKRCVEFCQRVSHNGPSGIIDEYGGDVFSYLLRAFLLNLQNSLHSGLDRVDRHIFADFGCILQQRSIPFALTPEELYSSAASKSSDTPLVAAVKYANFLRSQQRYEELVSLVIQHLNCPIPIEDKYLCIFSQFTPDILDEYLRWALWSLPELAFASDLLLYYLLILGYQKAGVFAELFMPGYFIPAHKTGWNHIQRVTDYAVIWASLLCHAELYDSAFLCCLCDPTFYFYIYLKGILFRFMYKCMAEVFLQLRKESVTPSGVYHSQRQLRQTWSGAMKDFQRRMTGFDGLSEQEQEEIITESTDVFMWSSAE